jgi:hypothetical protein
MYQITFSRGQDRLESELVDTAEIMLEHAQTAKRQGLDVYVTWRGVPVALPIYCANCGQALSPANVDGALQEMAAIDDVTDEARMRFYCPNYDSQHDTCPGYGTEDTTQTAYWTLR